MGNSQNGENTGKGNFFQSITFQNILVYALILIAFIIYTVISTSAIRSVKSQALLASENVLIIAQENAALERDIVQISAEINKTLGQLEGGTIMTEADFADMDAAIADIDDHLDYMDSCLIVSNLAGGDEIVANLRTSVNAFTETANNLKSCILKADIAGAITYVSSDYGTNLGYAKEAVAEINAGIDELNAGFDAYMDTYITEVSMTGYVVMALVVVLIIVSFVLSYVRINKTITGIASELDTIITDINAGKGNLTARIHTKTKTELAIISSGINQFISTSGCY